MPILKIEKLTKKYGKTYALNGLDMEVKKGDIYGFVGPNGAGKTTLTNLLLRLYDVTEGQILIDGEDIRSVNVQSHRDRFSAVFQDFQIFSASLGENVALDVDYDKGRVLSSLSHSGFDKELKNSTETELLREFDDNGAMLSGGESQKVAVARTFYKNCPLFLLGGIPDYGRFTNRTNLQ